jgi:hypothetical protein
MAALYRFECIIPKSEVGENPAGLVVGLSSVMVDVVSSVPAGHCRESVSHRELSLEEASKAPAGG